MTAEELARQLDRWIIAHYGASERCTSFNEILATIRTAATLARAEGRAAALEEAAVFLESDPHMLQYNVHGFIRAPRAAALVRSLINQGRDEVAPSSPLAGEK